MTRPHDSGHVPTFENVAIGPNVGGYRGACSCGWKGKTRTGKGMLGTAQRDALEHANGRAPQMRPKQQRRRRG